MSVDKTLLDRLVIAQLNKAEECFDLAKAQREGAVIQHDIAARQLDNAERQHANADRQQEIAARQHECADRQDANADRLAALGHRLNDGALEIKGETELALGRNCPPFRPPRDNNALTAVAPGMRVIAK